MSPRLPRLSPAERRRALERAGWTAVRQDGSHMQMKHPNRPGRVTIAFHAGTVVKPATLTGILKQAGLTADELRDLL